jgi:hypothetical protein
MTGASVSARVLTFFECPSPHPLIHFFPLLQPCTLVYVAIRQSIPSHHTLFTLHICPRCLWVIHSHEIQPPIQCIQPFYSNCRDCRDGHATRSRVRLIRARIRMWLTRYVTISSWGCTTCRSTSIDDHYMTNFTNIPVNGSFENFKDSIEPSLEKIITGGCSVIINVSDLNLQSRDEVTAGCGAEPRGPVAILTPPPGRAALGGEMPLKFEVASADG